MSYKYNCTCSGNVLGCTCGKGYRSTIGKPAQQIITGIPGAKGEPGTPGSDGVDGDTYVADTTDNFFDI